MRRILALVVTLMVLAACSASKEDGYIPIVDISYARGYDAVCSLFGPSIDETWRKELDQLLPMLENEWEASGRPVLIKVKELVGRGFEDDSYSVGLTLCASPSQDSWSGIRVNMRYALKSFTKDPVPLRYKVGTVVHELLHEFLREVPVENSSLLARHQAESARVLGHLHLFALLKAGILETGREEYFEEMVRIDSQLPGGVYKRAWEIVNSTPETYLQFLAELK